MRLSKFPVILFPIVAVGCSSYKLPMPEGDQEAMNTNGVPVDLMIAINRVEPIKKNTDPVIDANKRTQTYQAVKTSSINNSGVF
ncbi:hypothetical protein HLB25_20895, partial [Dickeya dadantii]